ncbi:MAG: OmpA family protein, partial [Halothiobacillaceae bacterium]|nr:OmpA family protein [Halothiobacillaceae bacterium]
FAAGEGYPGCLKSDTDKCTAYVYDGMGKVVRDGMGKCVLNGHIPLEASSAIKECNPEFFKAEAAKIEAPVAPTVSAKAITLNADAFFDFDKDTLKKEGKASLDALAKDIKIDQVEYITVVGHTDRFGSDSYNQKLSERRANTVAKYLTAKGIPSTKIKASGVGETQPVKECAGAKATAAVIKCLAPNRRAVITVGVSSK